MKTYKELEESCQLRLGEWRKYFIGFDPASPSGATLVLASKNKSLGFTEEFVSSYIKDVACIMGVPFPKLLHDDISRLLELQEKQGNK